jgi:hypothetical protein
VKPIKGGNDMTKAVIGIFDSSAEAQEAVRTLENRGITRDHVDITERMDTDTGTEKKDEGIGESISNFFSNLFGNDDDARNYSEVANRGCTVTVYTDSNEEAEDAADILDDCGAIDVDERITQYRSGMGSTGVTGSMSGTTPSGMNTGNISGMERERMAGDPNTGVPGSSGMGDTPMSRESNRSTGIGDSSSTGMGNTPSSGETGWSSPSGNMRSDTNQPEWSGRTASQPSDRPSSSESPTGSAKIHKSRIFDTPDDLRARIGRRHPSASDRGTTGDINPLNQQNPDWGL